MSELAISMKEFLLIGALLFGNARTLAVF